MSSRHKLTSPSTPRLSDLGGMAEAKAWGERLALDLKDYKAGLISWGEVDPGVLITGAPGTGKTSFAKALAATCDIKIVVTSYAQWQRHGSGHMGDVLAAMHQDFELAADNAPCILFIDELDTLPTRGKTRHNDEWWTGIVNGFLELLDGAEGRDGVVVVGASNDASTIDPAIVRAGRFDRRIAIPMPGIGDIETILAFHLGKDAGGIDDLASVAILAAGMSGAEVGQIVRDARRAARHEKAALSRKHLIGVIEGETMKLDAGLLRRLALHEAGHAVAAMHFEMSSDVTVSVVGGGTLGGRTVLLPREMQHFTRDDLENAIVMLLSGRAAEEVHLHAPSGGAGGSHHSDLALATHIATDIVTTLGLSERRSLLWLGRHSPDNPLLFNGQVAQEVGAILNAAYEKAVSLMMARHQAVSAIADALIERRALGHTSIEVIIRDNPGPQRLLAAPASGTQLASRNDGPDDQPPQATKSGRRRRLN